MKLRKGHHRETDGPDEIVDSPGQTSSDRVPTSDIFF